MASGTLVLVVNDAIDVDRACDAIGAAWHTTIESLFQIITLFRACLGKKGFKELQFELEKRGIMKAAVFSMFKSIAQNPLLDLRYKEHLPASYTSLYYLSRIEDESVFKRLILEGSIHQGLKLEDAKKFSSGYQMVEQKEYSSQKPTLSIMPVASIKIRREEFRKNRKQILALLDQLEGLGLIIKRSEELQ
jgi:hypothetical protein